MQNALFDFISQYVVLNEAEKQAITSLDIFRNVKKGEVLLHAGQTAKESYFILKGCVRTFYTIDGEEKTTAFYTEMDVIAPATVTTRQPSTYAIATTEDSIISVSTPDMEEDMFVKFPKFETMCRKMSEQLLTKQQLDFDAFKVSSPEERYISILETSPELLQRVPQHQLASFLGIKPQSLSRLRSRIMDKKQN